MVEISSGNKIFQSIPMNLIKKNINVTKVSGLPDIYSAKKLRWSLAKLGAGEQLIDNILYKIESILYDSIITKQIYQTSFNLLKKDSRSNAGRHNLKRAFLAFGHRVFPLTNTLEIFLNGRNTG